ncbi:MAG: LapA family protein, partial [Casimicrobiaceae bacterium]
MSILRWIVTAVVFLALLFISLQNSQPVTVSVLSFYTWQAPLVFVILIAFAAGVALGLLSAAIRVARLRRQLARAQRDLAATRVPPQPPAPRSVSASDFATRLPG